MSAAEFIAFPKIPRLNRTVTITEKIDGTNACVVIVKEDDGDAWVYAQSRKRIITPESDNFGFAAWVADHEEELIELGPGHHFGEWYGSGIQRNYGLDERRFALFNTFRPTDTLPSCVEQVPVLWRGEDMSGVNNCSEILRVGGSVAVPGFPSPEGIVVYHHASRQNFKVLLEGDEIPKGLAA